MMSTLKPYSLLRSAILVAILLTTPAILFEPVAAGDQVGRSATPPHPPFVLDPSRESRELHPPAQLTSLAFTQTNDKSVWVDVSGDLATGYSIALDPSIPYYYVNVKSLAADGPLGNFHSFYMDPNGVPDGFWEYWAAKSVTADATAGTSEQWMWRVINGWERLAAMLGWGETFTLLDGPLLEFYGQAEFLRIAGDYPLGAYTMIGHIIDTTGGYWTMPFQMTFTHLAAPQAPTVTVALAGSDVQLTWLPITKDVNSANTAIKSYQVYGSLNPYFLPGDTSSPLPEAEISGTEHLDGSAASEPGGYYYVVRAINSIGPSIDSNRTGKFTFSLTKG